MRYILIYTLLQKRCHKKTKNEKKNRNFKISLIITACSIDRENRYVYSCTLIVQLRQRTSPLFLGILRCLFSRFFVCALNNSYWPCFILHFSMPTLLQSGVYIYSSLMVTYRISGLLRNDFTYQGFKINVNYQEILPINIRTKELKGNHTRSRLL